jgi:hypothetical protein
MTYLLDANIFIQAKNLHYGFDFCPAFWDWLIEKNAAGVVASIEKVGDELQAGADSLADWVKERGDGFFLPPDNQIVPGVDHGEYLGEYPGIQASCRGNVPAGH